MVLFSNLKSKKIFLLVSVFICSTFVTQMSQADTMFEGYYKIRSGGVHVGFVIQRYSFDSKKKHFSTTYYIKTTPLAGNMTESLHATANDKFEPISYQYTNRIGKKIQTIDATFKGDKMTLVRSNGKTNNTSDVSLPKGTFLSSFLGYMLLSKGLSKGKVYNYFGVAEEQGKSLKGKVLVKEELIKNGIPAFKLLNEYGGTRYISTISKTGEVLDTKSPVQGIETKLVASPAEATKGLVIDSKSLRILFGNIPRGRINELYKAKKNKTILPEKVTTPTKED